MAVNPGGTNEAYVRTKLKNVTVRVVEDNLSIPSLVADGRADVMITDNVEAMLAASQDSRLAAPGADAPWTMESLGFMTHRDDQAFLNWLNLFLSQAEADGSLKALRAKYGLEAQLIAP